MGLKALFSRFFLCRSPHSTLARYSSSDSESWCPPALSPTCNSETEADFSLDSYTVEEVCQVETVKNPVLEIVVREEEQVRDMRVPAACHGHTATPVDGGADDTLVNLQRASMILRRLLSSGVVQGKTAPVRHNSYNWYRGDRVRTFGR